MSAVPKLREPEDLYAPEEIEHTADLLQGALTEKGQRVFLSEFLTALSQAKEEGDLRFLNRVVEAWVHTAVVLAQAGGEAEVISRIAHAEDIETPNLTLDAIRERLRLADR